MFIPYETAGAARGSGDFDRPVATACGAALFLLAAILNQTPMEAFEDRYELYPILYRLVLPLMACVGIVLLTGVVGAPRRDRRAILGRLAVLATTLGMVLGLLHWWRVPGVGATLFLRIGASLVAGSMLYLLLGTSLWHRGRRVLATQLFLVALVLPAATVAVFYDPRMQGASGLGLVPLWTRCRPLGCPTTRASSCGPSFMGSPRTLPERPCH